MELIPIRETEAGAVCNARDLHQFLEVGQDFSTWIKGRIEQYGFAEGEDYRVIALLRSPDPVRPKEQAQVRIEYELSLGMTKELSMVENNLQGRLVRRYIIATEVADKAEKAKALLALEQDRYDYDALKLERDAAKQEVKALYNVLDRYFGRNSNETVA